MTRRLAGEFCASNGQLIEACIAVALVEELVRVHGLPVHVRQLGYALVHRLDALHLGVHQRLGHRAKVPVNAAVACRMRASLRRRLGDFAANKDVQVHKVHDLQPLSQCSDRDNSQTSSTETML